MIALPIEMNLDRLEDFCRKWNIREFALFGSVLREDFGPDSDIDVLVSFNDSAKWSLLDVIEAEQELSELLGRKVDLVERSTVEGSENWIRRKSILDSAKTIYGG